MFQKILNEVGTNQLSKNIPITSYYQHQPPTKTFEYVLAGMACLATSTNENLKYINAQNGILHLDNPESFAQALEKITNNFPNYSSNSIRKTLDQLIRFFHILCNYEYGKCFVYRHVFLYGAIEKCKIKTGFY